MRAAGEPNQPLQRQPPLELPATEIGACRRSMQDGSAPASNRPNAQIGSSRRRWNAASRRKVCGSATAGGYRTL